jgi:acyl dehydratase
MSLEQNTWFADLKVGDEIGPLVRGPLSAPILMRWSAAVENWHRIHYDHAFATGHDKLPDLLVNGTLKQQLVMQLLRDWAGPRGFVWKVSFQFRAMNRINETLRMWGRVTRKRELPDYGVVDLEVGILNDEGKESTPGQAVVALPYDAGRSDGVPYPFVPPQMVD